MGLSFERVVQTALRKPPRFELPRQWSDATPLAKEKMIAAGSYLTGGTDPSPDADRQIKCQLLQFWPRSRR